MPRGIIGLWLSKGDLKVRLLTHQCTQVNGFLRESIRPSDFNRATLKIENYKMFKGKNFRTFLLYLGPICLKNVVAPNVYDNFMLLSCTIRVLCKPQTYQKLAPLAKKLLIQFVQSLIEVYGKCFVSYNVHNLIHLADDV